MKKGDSKHWMPKMPKSMPKPASMPMKPMHPEMMKGSGGKKGKRWDGLLVLALLALPFTVLAQEAAPAITFRGFDLSPLIGLLITIVTGLFAWLARRIAAAQAASAQQSAAQTALLKLSALALTMAGELWSEFSAEFQRRIADGQIDAADREAFRQLVAAKIEKYTSAEELRKIAEALGLPLPGIIAKVTEFVIDRLAKAHDPVIQDVSAKAFPVGASTDGMG